MTAEDDEFDAYLDGVLQDFETPKKEPKKETLDQDFVQQLTRNMEMLLAGSPGESMDQIMSAFEQLSQDPQMALEMEKALSEAALPVPAVPVVPVAPHAQATSASASNSIHDQVSRTMNKLKESDSMVGAEISQQAKEDPAIEALMKELEGMLETGDLDNVLGGIMDQIMSKELLHEPMKDLHAKWLKDNDGTLSIQDKERYQKQYIIVKEIVEIYDATPGKDASPADSKRVVELMQEMQNCGNPPDEILKDLAPGLELGADGTPNLANLAGDCSVM